MCLLFVYVFLVRLFVWLSLFSAVMNCGVLCCVDVRPQGRVLIIILYNTLLCGTAFPFIQGAVRARQNHKEPLWMNR